MNQSQHPTVVDVLAMIVGKQSYSPADDGPESFFGDRLILPKAEAQARDQGKQEELLKLLQKMQTQASLLQNLWGESSASGLPAALGWIKAIQFLLQRGQFGLLVEAARQFDEAWKPASKPLTKDIASNGKEPPAGQKNADSYERLPESFRKFAAEFEGEPRSIGFWTAWEILARLNSEPEFALPLLPGNAPKPESVWIPVLLHRNGDKRGLAARLTVKLIGDDQSVFYPDPFALGWTALTCDKTDGTTVPNNEAQHGFHNSLQRVWHEGLDMSKFRRRGCWGLAAFVDTEPMNLEHLDGRSLEAATACAILAARTRTSVEPDELDDSMAISAKLEIEDWRKTSSFTAKWQDIKLGEVHHLNEKLTAAYRTTIDQIIVAANQDPIPGEQSDPSEQKSDPPTGDPRSKVKVSLWSDPAAGGDTKHTIRIYRVATLGESYELLVQSNRWLKAVHQWHEDDFYTSFEDDRTTKQNEFAKSAVVAGAE